MEAARLKREQEASNLVAAGFPLLHLPALANPHAVLMSQTVRCVLLRCGVTSKLCGRCSWLMSLCYVASTRVVIVCEMSHGVGVP